MPTQATQSKRYKTTEDEASKERQLSSLFSIISNNLMLASEALSTDYKIKAVQELEILSSKAKTLAKQLVTSSNNLTKDQIKEKISSLKNQMLDLVVDLTEEINKLDSNKKSSQKVLEDIILAKRLLRESQRGLITIQD